jgi:hypothetical protein
MQGLAGQAISAHDRTMKKEAPMTAGPGEIEPSQFPGGERSGGVLLSVAAQIAQGIAAQGTVAQAIVVQVTFDRRELRRIFGLYGRKVAEGEWRDYAIDFLKDRAVFSIFRRSSEAPIYRIEKNPRLAQRQGAYSVVTATGLILRRGHELDRVLRAIDRSIHIVARSREIAACDG